MGISAEKSGAKTSEKVDGQIVKVGGRKEGYSISEKGESLPIRDVYSAHAIAESEKMLMGKPEAIYIRTTSGNVYCLKPDGTMSNLRDVAKGKPSLKLDISKLQDNHLTIGNEFIYGYDGGSGKTSTIREVVVVYDRKYPQSLDKLKVDMPTSDLPADFERQSDEATFEALKKRVISTNVKRAFEKKDVGQLLEFANRLGDPEMRAALYGVADGISGTNYPFVGGGPNGIKIHDSFKDGAAAVVKGESLSSFEARRLLKEAMNADPSNLAQFRGDDMKSLFNDLWMIAKKEE